MGAHGSGRLNCGVEVDVALTRKPADTMEIGGRDSSVQDGAFVSSTQAIQTAPELKVQHAVYSF